MSTLLIILALVSGACTESPAGSREGSQRVAEEFVRLETTFRFDGIPDTLKTTSTTSAANGWKWGTTPKMSGQSQGYTGYIVSEKIILLKNR